MRTNSVDKIEEMQGKIDLGHFKQWSIHLCEDNVPEVGVGQVGDCAGVDMQLNVDNVLEGSLPLGLQQTKANVDNVLDGSLQKTKSHLMKGALRWGYNKAASIRVTGAVATSLAYL